jgi:TetR/AcrR family transcriptional repressor of nem operon
MRLSREAKARHHQEIIEAAAAMLRARGIGGTSVADLMQAAGLTHGGFYRHFENKDELVAEAVKAAFDGIIGSLDNRIAEAGPAKAIQDYVKLYLSLAHIEHPEMGCPIATLGPEIARQSDVVRSASAGGVERLIGKLAEGTAGDFQARRASAIDLLCRLVGAIVIARAIAPADLANEILSVAGDASRS